MKKFVCLLLLCGGCWQQSSAQVIPAQPLDSLQGQRPPTSVGLVLGEAGAGILVGWVFAFGGGMIAAATVDQEDATWSDIYGVFAGATLGYIIGVPTGVHLVASGGSNIESSYVAALLGSAGGLLLAGLVSANVEGGGGWAVMALHLGGTIYAANRSRRYRTPPGQMAAFNWGARTVAISWPRVGMDVGGMQAGLQVRF